MAPSLTAAPTRLRAEHRDSALGVAHRAPRLSWRLPEPASRQTGYELSFDGQPCGRVESADTVLRPWPGPPLRSRELRVVRVRVWTDLGPSDWSEPLPVEAGLDAADWVALWVRPVERGSASPGFRPAYRLRGTAQVESPVAAARLHVTAHGLHVTTLNGERVTADELAPGYTEYPTRTQVMTYDVTDLVRSGENVIGALLADGWFRGSVGMPRATDQFGERTAYLAQLEVTHPDGTRTVTGSGADWICASSHISAADLMEGQTEDRRLVEPGWNTVGFDVSSWSHVEIAGLGYDTLVPSPSPPVRAVREVQPIAVHALAPGRHVVDLGENINGWTRLRSLGPEGTKIRLVHGEALDADGDVTTDHLRPDDIPFITHEVRAGMVDEVVSAGIDGDVFEPHFTTHGFRYVRVEGHPGPLTAEEVDGIVVNTDVHESGGFDCSADLLNELYAAAVRSFRGNACDIPTDCPTRERAGWTGDWQIYVPIATFHDDVAGFSEKWLRDLAAGQWDNGVVGNMAPMPPFERAGFLEGLNGSAGWGDAIVLVPWELYREYGDARLLEELWPNMERWVAYALNAARTERHRERIARSPEPAPHEEYLWDSGFHWGEWLVPGEDPAAVFARPDLAEVATAYLAQTTRTLSRVARVIGRHEDAARYEALAERVRDAWQAEFIDAAGHVRPRTQYNLVRALAFELVPNVLAQQVAYDLAALVRDNDTHLATGFLATRDLLPVLADHGHLDLAYDLLLQHTPPSWLAMLARGATTMWERWEGIDEDGVPRESLNHYSKGAVIGFLHGYVAGLQRLEPTWRRFRVAPRPGGGLTRARAWHDSPHGRIEVSWRLVTPSASDRDEDCETEVAVTVPPSCAAEVLLPDGSRHEAGPGSWVWRCRG